MLCANHLDGKKSFAAAERKRRLVDGQPAGAPLATAAAQQQKEAPQFIPLDNDEFERPNKRSTKRKRTSPSRRISSNGVKKSKSSNSATKVKVCALCHGGNVMGGDGVGHDVASALSEKTGTDATTANVALEGPFIEAPVRLKYSDRPNESVHVHLNCAVHSPEVYVKADGLIMNLPKAVKRGRQLKCTRCNQFGATVGCIVAKCRRNYHLRCAVESGGEINGTTYALKCKLHAAVRDELIRACVCDADEDDLKLTMVCSSCRTKFHPKCVNMSERQAARIAKTWVCSVCDGSAAAKETTPPHVPLKTAAKKPVPKSKSSELKKHGKSTTKATIKTRNNGNVECAEALTSKRKKTMRNRLSMPRNKSRSKMNGTTHGISPHMDADSDTGGSMD